MATNPQVGEFYQHYRNGRIYGILLIAENSANFAPVSLDKIVCYQCKEEQVAYFRGYWEFCEDVEDDNGNIVERFKKVENGN